MSEPVTSTAQDDELRAMLAVVKYFEPLNRGSRSRVIDWARDRYVMESMSDFDPAGFRNFTEALGEAARQMGDVTPLDIIAATQEIIRVRESA